MFWFLFIVSLIAGLYIILITRYYWAWKQMSSVTTLEVGGTTLVSIVIAARNEQNNISKLLNCLKTQNYDSSLFEVILVNDHSTDDTYKITSKFQEQFINLKAFNLPEGIEGKKNALKYGVNEAKGELILTLDADCQVGMSWVKAIASFYEKTSFKLIVCPLLYNSEINIFGKIQSLEIISLVASGAGAVALNRPIFCNGANLAFSREVYYEVNHKLKTEISSGDDVFLLLAVKKKWPNSIGFLKSCEAVAYTLPEPDLVSFFSQRKRWSSKSRFYKDFDILYTATIVFACNISIILSLIFTLFYPKFIFLFISLLCLKSLPDYLLIQSFSKYFNKAYLLKYFAMVQLVYPFYLVSVAVFGSIGNYKWKNRTCK